MRIKSAMWGGVVASVLSVGLVFSVSPSYADHEGGHDAVAQEGIKALEERIWDLEQGTQGPHPTTLNVDCGVASLQAAIDAAAEGTTINVTGTCNELIVFKKDFIKLEGGGSFDGSLNFVGGATIDGDGLTPPGDKGNELVKISGHGIEISGFTITNAARAGIALAAGGAAIISRNHIINNGRNGVQAAHRSWVQIGASGRNHIGIGSAGSEGNIIEGNNRGVNGGDNSVLIIAHNIIRGNATDGVLVGFGALARIDANVITGNGDNGIELFDLGIGRVGRDTNHGVNGDGGDPNNLVEGNADHGLRCTGPAIFSGSLPNFGAGNTAGNSSISACF